MPGACLIFICHSALSGQCDWYQGIGCLALVPYLYASHHSMDNVINTTPSGHLVPGVSPIFICQSALGGQWDQYHDIGYLVLVPIPVGTWWTMWPLPSCLPVVPRIFSGAHFRLGRPQSPGKWNTSLRVIVCKCKCVFSCQQCCWELPLSFFVSWFYLLIDIRNQRLGVLGTPIAALFIRNSIVKTLIVLF